MHITVKCFATLSHLTPEKGEYNALPEHATIQDLMQALNVPAEEVKIIFVNGCGAQADTILQDGDRVGLFPPVGGG